MVFEHEAHSRSAVVVGLLFSLLDLHLLRQIVEFEEVREEELFVRRHVERREDFFVGRFDETGSS